VIAVAVLAIGSPILQAQQDLGLSPAEFADGGDETLRAAGYAFSIWGLIYAGLLAFAVYQALPGRASRALDAAYVPAIGAMGLIGAWIWWSATDRGWLSVATILLATISAMSAARRASATADSRTDRLLIAWPFAALAGWLTVASVINLLTVLTKNDLIARSAATPAALVGLVFAAGVALGYLRWTRLWLYGLPVAWGLVAVFVAERADAPIPAWTAFVLALVVLAAAWVWRRPTATRR
jgi:hypothetical protein